jgi:hypothetical protein
MPQPPAAAVLEPDAVADWLDIDLEWIMRSIAHDGLPILGYRTDGIPLMATGEVQAWLRRPTLADDET